MPSPLTMALAFDAAGDKISAEIHARWADGYGVHMDMHEERRRCDRQAEALRQLDAEDFAR